MPIPYVIFGHILELSLLLEIKALLEETHFGTIDLFVKVDMFSMTSHTLLHEFPGAVGNQTGPALEADLTGWLTGAVWLAGLNRRRPPRVDRLPTGDAARPRKPSQAARGSRGDRDSQRLGSREKHRFRLTLLSGKRPSAWKKK